MLGSQAVQELTLDDAPTLMAASSSSAASSEHDVILLVNVATASASKPFAKRQDHSLCAT